MLYLHTSFRSPVETALNVVVVRRGFAVKPPVHSYVIVEPAVTAALCLIVIAFF